MIAASKPVQRPSNAKLLSIDRYGAIRHWRRAEFMQLLQPGDLVIANDAATLPASLQAVHVPSGRSLEVRLAARASLAFDDVRRFAAVVFGAGDFHRRTEDRGLPPHLRKGDELLLGPLHATINQHLGHPRFIELEFQGSPADIWRGLAEHGRPIQYSHMDGALELWDVWTPLAAVPVAFEPPSASFALDWHSIVKMRDREVQFETLTHAAGISSTGDPALDARLPLDEPYRIPRATAFAIEVTQACGGRVIAIGTTVVRALEHAVSGGVVKSGEGVATQRIGPFTQLKVVDAILSGTHEVASSHYRLLGAFAGPDVLRRADRELEAKAYRTHEFGDSVFIERAKALGARMRTDSACTKCSA